MADVKDLKIDLFADGANLEDIAQLAQNPVIKGFTTNPTLMKKANVRDYKEFALEALSLIGDRPVSFEVFSDDWQEMESQAREISSWGQNVYVKIPYSNTEGEFSGEVIHKLSYQGVKLNVTALMTTAQVQQVANYLDPNNSNFVSVFAGRIADTGRDPVPVMAEAVGVLDKYPKFGLIWASPRELLNIYHAESVGCHIITATSDILQKLNLVGKDLDLYSLETVRMFRSDALEAGYTIKTQQTINF